MRTMSWLLALSLSLTEGLPWRDLSLSIEKDRSTSSDHVTLCRVRVINHGSRTWPGRSLRFEARALDGGVVVATERGRFGLSLPPRGTLETIVGFVGRYDRFEVSPLPDAARRSPRRRTRA